jgi:hypothetical protein
MYGRPTTCSLDPIPSSFLQTISGDLLPFINSSLTTGYIPSDFKMACHLPQATLDSSDVKNYRPVCLSFLSKTLEHAVSDQLSRYHCQNDLLDSNQSGFKMGHSTKTALLAVTEALPAAKADALSSGLILLDLSAAFDTVNHQILLSTLRDESVRLCTLLDCILLGRPLQLGDVERICVCTTYSHYWCPPGLGPRPSSSLYTASHSSPLYPHMVSPSIAMRMTLNYFSPFSPSDTQVATRISAHHLKHNFDKTELLFLPGKA